MKSKACRECGEMKSLAEYYPHKMMGDGYLNKCKSCVKSRVVLREKSLRTTDPDWVLQERERGREKYHRLGYGEKPHKPTKNPNISRKRYPEKYRAHTMASRLPKKEGFHWHHWSYAIGNEKDCFHLESKRHARLHCFLVYDKHLFIYRTMDGKLLDTREKHEAYMVKVLG